MIRLLLILVLGQFVVEPTGVGMYGAPAITNKTWRGSLTDNAVEVFYPYIGNASYAARLMLNIHGMDELPDIDAEIPEKG